MKTIESVKTRLKKTIADNLGQTLKELHLILNTKTKAYDDYLILSSAFKSYLNSFIRDTKSNRELNVELANITQRVIVFIDSLEEDHLDYGKLLEREYFESILIVCKEESRVKFFQPLFPVDYFHGVKYDFSGISQDTEDFDIVIYDDNPPHDSKEEQDQLLLHYLKSKKPYVLYFGKRSPLIWDYPEKAYATNSIFSVHARLNEMINYIKYKGEYERYIEQKNTNHE
jgi:hypothetical protein